MKWNRNTVIYVLLLAGLAIIVLIAFNYEFSKEEPVLFAFWDEENDRCDLTIVNLSEQTSLQHQSPGACNYLIEEIDGSPQLIQLDPVKGTIEYLEIDNQEIVVAEQIQILPDLTDFPQFSAGASHVYFSAITDNIEQLYVIDVKANQIKPLLSDSQGIVTQPKLSPDKRYLTYVSLPSRQNRYECLLLPQTAYTEFVNPECLVNGDLYLLDLQTNEAINLTSLVADQLDSACRPSWSSDSRYLTVLGSCFEPGGMALIDVANNYQVIHFPESFSGGGWLSNNYVLFSRDNEEMTGFITVAYSVRDQTKTTLPETVLPPLSQYHTTSSNGCLVVDLQEEAALTIYCLPTDELNFTGNRIVADGNFYYASWLSENLFATYHQVLSSDGNWPSSVVIFDFEGNKLYEHEVSKIPLGYPLEPNFGWLSDAKCCK